MQCDVAVIGGGMSGVMAAAVAKLKGAERVTLIEPGRLATSYQQGGYRYLRRSDAVEKTLNIMKIPYHLRQTRGGLLRQTGEVMAFPGDISTDAMGLIQRSHYLKTRGTLEGYSNKVMNFAGANPIAVDVDIDRIVNWVHTNIDVVEAPAKFISGTMIGMGDKKYIEPTRLMISTVPLPLLGKLLRLEAAEAPTCRYMGLAVANIPAHLPGVRRLIGWDYMYTPWLRALHRIHRPMEPFFQVEWNIGLIDHQKPPQPDQLLSSDVLLDLMDIGLERAEAEGMSASVCPGHLLPVQWGEWRPESMEMLRLMGRFAAWDGRCTVDQVVDQAWEL